MTGDRRHKLYSVIQIKRAAKNKPSSNTFSSFDFHARGKDLDLVIMLVLHDCFTKDNTRQNINFSLKFYTNISKLWYHLHDCKIFPLFNLIPFYIIWIINYQASTAVSVSNSLINLLVELNFIFKPYGFAKVIVLNVNVVGKDKFFKLIAYLVAKHT